jgi:murein DD-endopeptidase MepM/ murein hydrolase activator NlpD
LHRIKWKTIQALGILLLGISLLGAAPTYQMHTVRKGDTLYGLAKRYGVTVNELKQLNNLSGSSLSIGQQLKVKPLKPETKPKPKQEKKPVVSTPQPTQDTQNQPEEITADETGATYVIHTVKRGDSLFEISKRYGVTVTQIKQLNNLRNNRIDPGQKLRIKQDKPAATPPKPAEKKPVVIQEQPPAPEKREVQPPVVAVADTAVTGTSTPPAEADYSKINPALLPEDYFHTVKAKENLYRISLGAGITLQDLLKYNNFPDEHVLIKPGQKLIIKDPVGYLAPGAGAAQTTQPEISQPGTELAYTAPDSVLIEKVYIVQRKDTLFKIARENNMTVEQLKRLNNLTSNNLKVGQRLYITAPRDKQYIEAPKPLITEEDLKAKSKIRTDLIMPLEGKILSEYGIRNGRPHKGIDLGAAMGVPIYAVLDGTVVYSGLQGNYGNVVVIEHPDFVMTVYAHNEKNLVSVGETVKQGQVIATVGATGNATGSHCHFEYRIKGKAINPRKVLPLDK